jgi:hypothetical protein
VVVQALADGAKDEKLILLNVWIREVMSDLN